MSTREWKPGDVAIWDIDGQTEVIYFRHGGPDWDEPGWQTGDNGEGYPTPEQLRPAVVIDPEDVPLDDLLRALDRWHQWSSLAHEQAAIKALFDQIAEQTKPPKPDEPTGLYARVVDDSGAAWVRTAEQSSVWRRELRNGDGRRYLIPQDGCRTWDEITAVRVLSDGVTS